MKSRRNIVFDAENAPTLLAAIDPSPGPKARPGELLRLLRTALRMSQVQMARRSGIDQAHIARIESGQVDLQWSSLERLFKALSCQPALSIRPDESLEEILERRIRLTAHRRVIWKLKLFPDQRLTRKQRHEKEEDWATRLSNRRTSEIWEDE